MARNSTRHSQIARRILVRDSLRKQLGPTYEWDTRKLLTGILGPWDVTILAGLNWLRTS